MHSNEGQNQFLLYEEAVLRPCTISRWITGTLTLTTVLSASGCFDFDLDSNDIGLYIDEQLNLDRKKGP
jgi:hypothetical protein